MPESKGLKKVKSKQIEYKGVQKLQKCKSNYININCQSKSLSKNLFIRLRVLSHQIRIQSYGYILYGSVQILIIVCFNLDSFVFHNENLFLLQQKIIELKDLIAASIRKTQ